MFCAVGCFPFKSLYIFPNRVHDQNRRKAWLDFFDMEEPSIDNVFACERHFSPLQTTTEGIRTTAVPDISITCVGTIPPFRRKPKNWRKNVVVVTPRDPEFAIYRHETGVFPQNLFNVSDTVQPVIQMPMIRSVSCSMPTQTNTRLCGLVQISDIKEEYSLSCFYCDKIFDIEKWSKFVNHLKNYHLVKEEAFKTSRHIRQDHDYAVVGSPSINPVKPSIKLNLANNSIIEFPQPVNFDPIILPPLLSKPQKSTEEHFQTLKTSPPPLLAKPNQTNDIHFNTSLADQLIKLLNETVLSPNFLKTEEDNILIIKNTGSNNFETSSFLTNLMQPEDSFTPSPQKTPKSCASYSSPRNSRRIFTINHGQKDIPSTKYSMARLLLPPLPRNKMAKLVQKRIAQQALKNIDVFENVYKIVKTRHPKVIETESVHMNDSNSYERNERQISNVTPLSRCLRRTIAEKTQTLPKKPKATEIVFEYTARDIVVSLLENMKNYPVLWEFHDQPFNKVYNKAIEELCRIINDKWSLNITLLKMRRSLNRILRFYRCMLPRESIEKFEDYFDKCALFLPSSTDDIPRARCPYCCICYKKDSELRKHIIIRHKSLKWLYKCPHCFERFRESDEYELHKRLPHYEEIFKCERCEKRFNRRHLYNKHVSSHQRSIERRMEAAVQTQFVNSSHVCDVCNKQFKTPPELKRHKIYHGEKKFKCHFCPKEFSIKMSLKLHLKRHRNELDFMCEICGKGFVRKTYLDEHMDKHTGAKITCNICNLKLRKCSLSRHLRLVHVPTEGIIEGTYSAKSHRYRKFVFQTQTKKRSRAKTELPRQYNCRICKIPFDRLKHLKDHNKQMHSDVKRFPCRICNFEFMHLSNLKRHYRAKHKLHMYQIFKLIYQEEDLNTVLAMKIDQDNIINNQDNIGSQDDDYIEQGRMHSDKIQDEIMKAVESLDNTQIKVDDDHSMNDFFTDLLK